MGGCAVGSTHSSVAAEAPDVYADGGGGGGGAAAEHASDDVIALDKAETGPDLPVLPQGAGEGGGGAEEEPESTVLSRLVARLLRSCVSTGALEVATMTVANGGDNIGIYVPLFSTASAGVIVTTLVIFYVMLLVWCAGAYGMVRCPPVARFLAEHGKYVVPFLLMALGVYVLWGTVMITPAAA